MSRETPVILAAHGAGDGSAANRLVGRLCEEVRERTGRRVAPAFNLGSPTFEESVRVLGPGRCVVVPLMMAEGYFLRVLRERCEGAAAACGASLSYALPLGASGMVQDRIVERVRGLVGADGLRTSILVVGHGTSRDARSEGTAVDLVGRLREETAALEVEVAFLDQDPSIERVVDGISSQRLVVVPFLLGGGGHALEDVPRRLSGWLEGAGRSVVYDRPVGDDPGLGGVVARLVEARLAKPEIRLGTRGSELARRQAERVRERLEREGAAVRFVFMRTVGDDNLDVPVEALPGDAPFAEEIGDALRTGMIDLATHSLKDLALDVPDGLSLGAFLERGDPGEGLVTRDGGDLGSLPAGARVGTSSGRRTEQVRALRDDLEFVSMRGPVDDRVAQVDRGDFDGAILAVAGLERLGLGDRISQRFTDEEVLPAPGQGVIVVQCHRSRGDLADLLSRVDHAATRACADAELGFARGVERRDGSLIAAARAWMEGEEIVLRARVIEPETGIVSDATERGQAPEGVALAAAARCVGVLAREGGVAT